MNNHVNILLIIYSALTAYLLYQVSEILTPFILAGLISYLLSPLVKKLENYKINRSIASAISLLLVVFIISFLITIFLPMIIEQLKSFSANFPNYKIIIKDKLIPKINNILDRFYPNIGESIHNSIDKYMTEILSYFINLLSNFWNTSMVIINIISIIFLTPLISFYFLRDFHKINNFTFMLIPKNYRSSIMKNLELIQIKLSSFIRGQTYVCIILGLYHIIMLSLVGMNYSVLIGTIIGVMFFVPYIGFMISAFICFLIAYFQFNFSLDLILVVSILIAGQILEGVFITPKIIGEKVGLHPVWIIFSMLANGILFGITGIILAIPIAAIISVFFKIFIETYLNSNFYQNKD